MKPKPKGDDRPIQVYTVIGAEWFTLLARKARTAAGVTVLEDVINLDEEGRVLDQWSEVKLSNVPLLLARK